MKILYIVGAGASCAMSGKIPGIGLLDPISRFFPAESELLSKALAVTGAYLKLGSQLARKGPSVAYPTSVGQENLEDVLQGLEEIAVKGTAVQAEAADEAHELIRSLISRLFSKLHEEGVESPDGPYELLAAAIKADNHNHQHAFISFNYDIWLERALQRHGLWNPVNGYLDNSMNPMRQLLGTKGGVLRELPTHEHKPSIVLKPHGSLSWLTPKENPFSNPIFLLDTDSLDKDKRFADGAVTYLESSSDELEMEFRSDGKQIYTPLIIPPVTNKAVGGEFLYKVHKAVERVIASAEVVVIIGWSMPASDFGFRQRIGDGLGRRNDDSAIERILVCDLNRGRLFYNRYRSVFPAKDGGVFDAGFGDDFVNKALKPLWAGQ